MQLKKNLKWHVPFYFFSICHFLFLGHLLKISCTTQERYLFRSLWLSMIFLRHATIISWHSAQVWYYETMFRYKLTFIFYFENIFDFCWVVELSKSQCQETLKEASLDTGEVFCLKIPPQWSSPVSTAPWSYTFDTGAGHGESIPVS